MLPKQRVALGRRHVDGTAAFPAAGTFFEHLIEARLRSVETFTQGFLTLEIDNGLLEQGEFALKAKGVFPDGTAFSMPEDIPLPPPLVLGEGCGKVVCLSVLMDIAGNAQIDLIGMSGKAAVFAPWTPTCRIATTASARRERHACARCSWGAVTRLSLEDAVSSAESVLPVGFVRELTSDRRVLLDGAPCRRCWISAPSAGCPRSPPNCLG